MYDDLPGKVSRKMISPNNAVSMKLALVLMTLTRTVLLASVRARVKRPHMIALNRRFIAKKNCAFKVRGAERWQSIEQVRTPLTSSSNTMLSFFRPKKCDSPVAHDVVSWVVVNLAKTPLRAAQAPEEMA